MNCRRVRGLLVEYLEKALPMDGMEWVDEHVECCRGCRDELEVLRRTLLLAGGDRVGEMPVSAEVFLANVRRGIRARGSRGWSWDMRRALWPVLAAAVVIVAAGVLLLTRRAPLQLPEDGLRVTREWAADEIVELAGTESELIRRFDAGTMSRMESELAEDAELDDLVEELTAPEQAALVRELSRVYRAPAKSLNGG
jgi:HEAT repeat protein